jgi:hypothetical protein
MFHFSLESTVLHYRFCGVLRSHCRTVSNTMLALPLDNYDYKLHSCQTIKAKDPDIIQ